MSRRYGTIVEDAGRGWYSRACPYGYCAVWLVDGGSRIDGGVGPVGCPHENTPGWDAHHYEGLGRPRPSVLPRGRHASRVRRSIARHRVPR